MKIESIEDIKKLARVKAFIAAPFYNLDPGQLSRLCCRGDVPGARKLGGVWYVTPNGMDRLFDGKRKR